MIHTLKLIWATVANNTEIMAWLLGVQVFLIFMVLVIISSEENPTAR